MNTPAPSSAARSRFRFRGAVFASFACILLLAGVRARTAGQAPSASADGARPLKLLFLGSDDGAHKSAELFTAIAPSLARHGIQLTHVSSPDALTPQVLGDYDALLVYGDQKQITPDAERAVVSFVEGGKGLVALHSAAEMFPGSPAYANLIGARAERGGSAQFTAQIVAPANPIVQGIQPFATTDDTYTFTNQNTAGRTVLMERTAGATRQPQTWVRTQGKGRVFYTAYGHDAATWSHPEFEQLVERGILYAVPDEARKTWSALKMPAVQYEDGYNIPNYENRDPAPKYQLPFSAQDSMKFMQVPAGFSLELFAS
jgi:type 1 glutamine amidotransferase